MTKKPAREDMRERAALYALGAMTPDEARAFEADLAGDPQCDAELSAFRAIVDDLAYAAPPQEPPAGLRERVMARIAADAAPRFDRQGISFVRGARLEWQPGSVAGVEVKPLAVDVENHRHTLLVRMVPGTVYPAHRHEGVEEIYMLEGDYLIDGVLMHAGDYCHAATGTVHEESHTISGCLLMVTASMLDQPIR